MTGLAIVLWTAFNVPHELPPIPQPFVRNGVIARDPTLIADAPPAGCAGDWPWAQIAIQNQSRPQQPAY